MSVRVLRVGATVDYRECRSFGHLVLRFRSTAPGCAAPGFRPGAAQVHYVPAGTPRAVLWTRLRKSGADWSLSTGTSVRSPLDDRPAPCAVVDEAPERRAARGHLGTDAAVLSGAAARAADELRTTVTDPDPGA